MEIEFNTTTEDIVAWNVEFVNSNRTMQRFLTIVRYGSPVAFAAALVHWGFIRGLFQGVFVLAVTWAATALRQRGRKPKAGPLTRTLVAQQVADSPSAVGPRRLAIDEFGISETHGAGAQITRWSDVRGTVLTSTHVFIRIGAGAAYIIPRASVDSAALEQFMTKLQQFHLAGRSRIGKSRRCCPERGEARVNPGSCAGAVA